MRILDKSGKEITNPDLEKGHLETEKIIIAHHEAVPASPGVSHIEVIKTYDNGGKDVMRVWDEKPKEAVPAYDETETIQRYIPYTELELAKIAADKEAAENAMTEDDIIAAIADLAAVVYGGES